MKEKKLHNVTLMIKSASDNEIDISSVMKNIDFHEKTSSTTSFKLSPEHQKTYYQYEESLACNIVNNLPFDMYKDYVTEKWIEHAVDDSKSTVVFTAIRKKQYALVSLLLDKASEYRKNNIKNFEFAQQYERNLLKPVLDLNTNIGNLNSDEVDLKQYADYLTLFKKALAQFKTHYDERGVLFSSSIELDKFNMNNWFENYKQITSMLYINSDNKDNAIMQILKRKEAYPFFNEIFLMQADNRNNPYIKKEFYQKTMFRGNETVLQHLDEWIKPTEKFIENTFEKAMSEWIEKYHDSIGRAKFFDDGKDHLHIQLQTMLAVFEKRVPEYFLKNQKADLLQYYAGIDYPEFDQVRKLHINEDTILMNGLNIRQWNYIHQCTEEFEQNNDFTKEKVTLHVQYAQTINKSFSDIEKPLVHEYQACHDFLTKNILNVFSCEKGQAYRNKAFDAFLLDKSLPQNEEKSPNQNVKIKI